MKPYRVPRNVQRCNGLTFRPRRSSQRCQSRPPPQLTAHVNVQGHASATVLTLMIWDITLPGIRDTGRKEPRLLHSMEWPLDSERTGTASLRGFSTGHIPTATASAALRPTAELMHWHSISVFRLERVKPLSAHLFSSIIAAYVGNAAERLGMQRPRS